MYTVANVGFRIWPGVQITNNSCRVFFGINFPTSNCDMSDKEVVTYIYYSK